MKSSEQQHCPASPDDSDGIDEERRDVGVVVGSRASRAARLAALVAAVVLLGVTRGVPLLIVLLSVVLMIFLHELGHYVAAKRAGMKVTEFFLGFGPRVWSFHRGETEYGIKAIPAGAYVRIVGMNNLDEVDPVDEPRTYRQAPFRSRFSVAVAGSAMHFTIALTLLFVQFAFIGWTVGNRWEVDRVTPHSAAAAAGIRSGDEIISFDGRPVSSFAALSGMLRDVEPGTVPVTVRRDGQAVELSADLSRRVKVVGTVGEDFDVIDGGDGLRVGVVSPGGALEAARLQEGATLVSIQGRAVRSLAEIGPAVSRATGGRLSVVTADGARTGTHQVDLGRDVAALPPTAFLGVGDRPVLQTQSIPQAAGSAVAEFGRLVGTAVGGVGRFVWPPNLFRFVSGGLTGAVDRDPANVPTRADQTPVAERQTRPVSIVGAVMVGTQMTSENAAFLVLFLVQLNIFIGVFNLIPLLPFDGGHVVIACYERAQELRRRSTVRHIADVSRLIPVAYGVVMVLAVVGLMAMYLDVTRGISL
ncbi:MAG: M50 family metallopeptidase [Actinomycetes bacterium]